MFHLTAKHFRVAWIFIAPIAFSPLLFFSKPAACAYGILLISSFWLVEVVPLAVTSLLPIFIFPVLGIASSKVLCSQYLKDTSMLFLSTLMMSLAVEESGLHRRVALKMLSKIGANPLALMVGMMLVVVFISFLISDTATTALMLPIAVTILESMMQCRTSEEDPKPRQRGNSATSHLNSSVPVHKRLHFDHISNKDRALCKAIILICAQGSLIGGTAMLTSSGPNLVFREKIHEALGEEESKITYLSWMEFSFPPILFYAAASLFSIQVVFLGPHAMITQFKKPLPEDVEILKKAHDEVKRAYDQLGSMSFSEKSAMFWLLFALFCWIFRRPGFIKGWAELFLGENGQLVTDTTAGIFVVFVLFAWPRKCPKFLKKATISPKTDDAVKATEDGYEPLLSWRIVQERFPWSVILLIGAGFAISEAIKASCLEDLIMTTTRRELQGLSKVVLLFVVTSVITFVTGFASNTATASVFIPIAFQLALSLHVHPLYLTLPAAIAPSFSFMFPMATAPNAIVYNTGVISMYEMAIVGLILNVLCIIIICVNMNTWAYWLFDLDTFPKVTQLLFENSTCQL